MSSDQNRQAPRARNRAAKRQAFVDVARSLLAAEGIDALTMQRVATELDCGVGSIYRYFPSKDALVAAAQREQLDALRAALAARRDQLGRIGAGRPLDGRTAALAMLVLVGRSWVDAAVTMPAEVATARRLAVLPEARPAIAELVSFLQAPLDAAVAVGALEPADNAARVQVVLVGVVDAVAAVPAADARVHGLQLYACLLAAWGAEPGALARADAALEEGS